MDGHLDAVHDAGLGKDERPAERPDARTADRQPPQPCQRRAIVEGRRVAAGADEQKIELLGGADSGVA